ncbi:hypothetical protein [Yinghuangia seranimata]|uniref:hypothetical protein n=1 Tax=Yinghuangia seranimata TaxID=408067 RepID=UPI00248C1E7D|nr:hypothetical protein [Yinghuangia seranimata]MDI2128508.1 hypothetical protein [Yinghuangia seranimata]
MDENGEPCVICGHHTLWVPGATEVIPPYWRFLDTWSTPARILDGSLHFACLRTAPFAEAFRDELVTLLTAGPHSVEVRLAGFDAPVAVERNVPGYDPEPVFSGTACRIFGSPNGTRFLVVEEDGPWHPLRLDQARLLAAGEPVHGEVFDTYIELERPLTTAAEDLSFPELVDALDLAAYYPDADAVQLTVFGYDTERQVLNYGTKAPLPIPAEAVEAVKDLLAP